MSRLRDDEIIFLNSHTYTTDDQESENQRRSNKNQQQNDEGSSDNNYQQSDNILCLLHKNRRLGAAYYDLKEKIVYFYEVIMDEPPQYLVTVTLLREVVPKFVIGFGSVTDEFNQLVIECLTSNSNETSVSSNTISKLPPNFFLLNAADFSYEICKTIVSNIDVSCHKFDTSNSHAVKRNLCLNLLVDFDNRLSVQALGALYKYFEKNWTYFGIQDGHMVLMDLCKTTLKNHVLIDNNTFSALNIFSHRPHEALVKRGAQMSGREGMSLYKLYSAGAKSKIGHHCLRNILLNPINNATELNKRLNFINFIQDPAQRDFLEALQDNIKCLGGVSDINVILVHVENGKASNSNWQNLYKTIYHSIFISELCVPHIQRSEILRDLQHSITTDLMALEGSINNALDFEAGKKRQRPAIKFGLDESLDAKLLRQQDILKHVTAAARCAVDDLPGFINECKIAYLPEMGHLMVVRQWEPDCDPNQLQDLGFQFMFTLKGMIHYKSPLCEELDQRLGDINADIIDHENRLLRRLSSFTVNYNKDIREPLKIIALIDCLISMAQVAKLCSFIRPTLNTDSIYEVQECRHPLIEHTVSAFESNDFYSGGEYPKMKIITGPNGSGKSVFLKQLGLVLYMAHIGSYIPAKKANIGLLHSMHCRLQVSESVSVNLSGFMIDIMQATQAINNAKSNSLVIMDEFGKGTTAEDGLAILSGLLKSFIENKDTCPHVVTATHFQKVSEYIPEGDAVQYMKMQHITQDGSMCFLHKLVEGVSVSYAFDIASQCLDDDLMLRIKYIYDRLKSDGPIEPLPSGSGLSSGDPNEIVHPPLDTTDEEEEESGE